MMNSPTNNLLLDQIVYLIRFFYRLLKRSNSKEDVPIASGKYKPVEFDVINNRLRKYLKYYDPVKEAFSIYVLPEGYRDFIHLVDSPMFESFLNDNKYLVRFRRGHNTKCKGGAIYFAIKSPLMYHVLIIGNAINDWWLIPAQSEDVTDYMEILRKL